MIPRDTITRGLGPTALYPQMLFTELLNTSDLSNSPSVVAAPKTMGIVPSCLELGEISFLDVCKDV